MDLGEKEKGKVIMVEIILSFDTEDYMSPYSDNAILKIAQILKEENIKGCFNIVGELARTLRQRNRDDIISLLQFHEINYHSFKHSWHPTIVEYTDIEDWDLGYENFLKEEIAGISLVKEIFQRDKIWASVPPGNCISPQAICGYVNLGIPIYSGSLFKNTSGRGIWFCNALNLENNCYIDSLLLNEGIDGVLRNIDNWMWWERVIMCCHPNIIIHEEFSDSVNMKGGNLVKWGNWVIPGKRPDGVIDKFFYDFRDMIKMIKATGKFRFVTYEDIWTEYKNQECRNMTKNEFMQLLPLLKEKFFYAELNGKTFSPAEIFMAAIHFLSGKEEDYCVEKIVGPVYEPVGTKVTLTLGREEVINIAMRLSGNSGNKFIPASIRTSRGEIGPRDFLTAAHQVLEGKKNAKIDPAPQLPDTTDFYGMGDFRLINTWQYPNSFKDEWITKRLKWQSWTIRAGCCKSRMSQKAV
jgi:hypothetical protein